jgi:hypothetical protein
MVQIKLKGEPSPTLPYPRVLSEVMTIQRALKGESLARIGDGELRLMHGGKHIAQETLPELAAELRSITKGFGNEAQVCIPNTQVECGKPEFWSKHSLDKYRELYEPTYVYGSSFICRPDSAPWIDQPHYWLAVRKLWEGRDVTLVIGERGGSLTYLHHAKSVRVVYGPERDAYKGIAKLEEEIGHPKGIVLLCLGPTATCLAERLAKKGLWAVDLGHMGRFMPQRYLQP